MSKLYKYLIRPSDFCGESVRQHVVGHQAGTRKDSGVQVLNATTHAKTLTQKTTAAQTSTIPYIDAEAKTLRVGGWMDGDSRSGPTPM